MRNLSRKMHTTCGVCEKHGVMPSLKSQTPISPTPDLDVHLESPSVDSTKCRALLGATLHVSCASRPDACHAISRLSRCSEDPREMHYNVALRVLRCLANTAHYYMPWRETSFQVAFIGSLHRRLPRHLQNNGEINYRMRGHVQWRTCHLEVATPNCCRYFNR